MLDELENLIVLRFWFSFSVSFVRGVVLRVVVLVVRVVSDLDF